MASTCCRSDKALLTPHGVYDATADLERVADFWRRYPAASVAMRTGQVSNVVALDLDSQDAITEALRRGLPDDTNVVRTRRGWHWLFYAPDEPLQSGDLFSGAELKAENVYVVAPPSMHPSGRRYRLIPSPTGRLATLPAWNVEAAEERQHEDAGFGAAITVDLDGPPIPQGTRNRALFDIACSLRARGAAYAAIAAHLAVISASRCTPPLEHGEVDDIAKNVCRRYAPGTAAPHVTEEVHKMLDSYTMAVYGNEWSGRAGKSDRDILLTLGSYGRRYGTAAKLGVTVVVSHRDVALAAAVSRCTLRKSIHERLKPSGWLLTPNANRQTREAGTFVLRVSCPQVTHSSLVGKNLTGMSGELTDIPRLRHGGLGKKAGHLVDTLYLLGGTATVKDIAEAMHEPRSDRLLYEYVQPLVADGILDFDAATSVVALSDGWESNLQIKRGLKGEIRREERQRHAAKRYWFQEENAESEKADECLAS